MATQNFRQMEVVAGVNDNDVMCTVPAASRYKHFSVLVTAGAVDIEVSNQETPTVFGDVGNYSPGFGGDGDTYVTSVAVAVDVDEPYMVSGHFRHFRVKQSGATASTCEVCAWMD
jgi:hypothetical protein